MMIAGYSIHINNSIGIIIVIVVILVLRNASKKRQGNSREKEE
jgi:uncharacterized membrane protein (UPF0136 family)